MQSVPTPRSHVKYGDGGGMNSSPLYDSFRLRTGNKLLFKLDRFMPVISCERISLLMI